ncbi:NADH:ubiquinone oxidoreductase subunit NDUFA12 [Acidiphilium sp.]|uniref:NADH:ubiquinone oxidoreductase subunit NDUFA12 n=1 Tax=Acidiphilium sp. TaxID=527 RepID=UPI003D031DA8
MKATDDNAAGKSGRVPSRAAPTLASLGGWRALINNPGLILTTLRRGLAVGQDSLGNRYFEERHPTRPDGRARRWVIYAGRARDASLVPAEWHAWLHFTTDAPLPAADRRPWQLPHLPNLTGTAMAYRPQGHDYRGGVRAHASADYEPWTPDA